MGRTVLSAVNWVRWATITASAAAPAHPASNVATSSPTNARWRLPAAAGWVRFDFGAPVEIGVIALVQPDRDPDLHPVAARRRVTLLDPVADTIRHRLDLETPGLGAAADSGPLASGIRPRQGVHCWLPPAPVLARYVEIEVASTVLTSIDVGLVWIGPALVLTEGGLEYDWGERPVDGDTPAGEGRAMIQYVDKGARAREWDLPLGGLSTEERAAVAAMTYDVGRQGQMLVTLDRAAPHATTLIGRLPAGPDRLRQHHPHDHSTNLTIVESR